MTAELPNCCYNNNVMLEFPFPMCSGHNTVYKILEYSSGNGEKDKDELASITVREMSLTMTRTGQLDDYLEKRQMREIDLDMSMVTTILRSVTYLDSCLSEWRYVCISEGEPYNVCICGEVIRYQHCIQNTISPEVILCIGTDCLSIFKGSALKIIGDSLESLVDDLGAPCGTMLIEYASKLKLIEENDKKILLEEHKDFSFTSNKKPSITLNTIDLICRQMTAKFKIAQAFVRGFLYKKLKRTISAMYHEMASLAYSETCVISTAEIQYIKSVYWKKTNPDDPYASAYQGIGEKRSLGKALSPKEQSSWKMFMEQKMKRVLEDTVEFAATKIEFVNEKVKRINQVVKKLDLLVIGLDKFVQMSLEEFFSINVFSEKLKPTNLGRENKEPKKAPCQTEHGSVGNSRARKPDTTPVVRRMVFRSTNPDETDQVTGNKAAQAPPVKPEAPKVQPKQGMRIVTPRQPFSTKRVESVKVEEEGVQIQEQKEPEDIHKQEEKAQKPTPFKFIHPSTQKLFGVSMKNIEKTGKDFRLQPEASKQPEVPKQSEVHETNEMIDDDEEDFSIEQPTEHVDEIEDDEEEFMVTNTHQNKFDDDCLDDDILRQMDTGGPTKKRKLN